MAKEKATIETRVASGDHAYFFLKYDGTMVKSYPSNTSSYFQSCLNNGWVAVREIVLSKSDGDYICIILKKP